MFVQQLICVLYDGFVEKASGIFEGRNIEEERRSLWRSLWRICWRILGEIRKDGFVVNDLACWWRMDKSDLG